MEVYSRDKSRTDSVDGDKEMLELVKEDFWRKLSEPEREEDEADMVDLTLT